MPRNQSEKLERCPEAVAYAEYCEERLREDGSIISRGADGQRQELFKKIPDPVRIRLWNLPKALAANTLTEIVGVYVDFIRKTYAA